MKTKIFNVWTDLVETYLHDVATQVPYSELSAWMDTEGARLFQIGQAEFHAKNKDKYLEHPSDHPPSIEVQLAYEQIGFGFNKVLDGLSKQFTALDDMSKYKFQQLIGECRSEKFLPFIALRAAITYKTVKDNDSDKLKAMDAVIDDFKLIIRAAQASIL